MPVDSGPSLGALRRFFCHFRSLYGGCRRCPKLPRPSARAYQTKTPFHLLDFGGFLASENLWSGDERCPAVDLPHLRAVGDDAVLPALRRSARVAAGLHAARPHRKADRGLHQRRHAHGAIGLVPPAPSRTTDALVDERRAQDLRRAHHALPAHQRGFLRRAVADGRDGFQFLAGLPSSPPGLERLRAGAGDGKTGGVRHPACRLRARCSTLPSSSTPSR